jgi:hypothetical protein
VFGQGPPDKVTGGAAQLCVSSCASTCTGSRRPRLGDLVRSRPLAPSMRTMTRDPGLAPEEGTAETEVSRRPGALVVARGEDHHWYWLVGGAAAAAAAAVAATAAAAAVVVAAGIGTGAAAAAAAVTCIGRYRPRQYCTLHTWVVCQPPYGPGTQKSQRRVEP